MLMRFDPFRELDTLTQALATGPGVSRGTVMAMDAYRDGDRVVVHLDLPGIDPETIDLTVEKNVLTVTAERRWEPSEGQEVIVSERRQGRFTRQLFLGESLDPDRLEASYDRGVLTLTVPVAEQAQPRKVRILSRSESRPTETTATNESGSGTREREASMAATSGR
jgi:HSP20 family protein